MSKHLIVNATQFAELRKNPRFVHYDQVNTSVSGKPTLCGMIDGKKVYKT